MGAFLPGTESPGWEAWYGAQTPAPWGASPQLSLFSCLQVTCLGVWVLIILHLSLSNTSHYGSFFIYVVAEDIFC